MLPLDSATICYVDQTSNLGGIAVEEVDAVPRVCGLAFAHPPATGDNSKDSDTNVKVGMTPFYALLRLCVVRRIPTNTSAGQELVRFFQHPACAKISRQRLWAALSPSLLQPLIFPVPWGRPCSGKTQDDRHSFKPQHRKTLVCATHIDIAGSKQ